MGDGRHDPVEADRHLDDEAWFSRVRGAVARDEGGRLAGMEVIEEVGAGGQGRVYKARQEGTGRLVAVKRLLAGAASRPDELARFRREVELAASLRHPGIVTVLGLAGDAGSPALVMEWVDGVAIDAWADRVRGEPGGLRRIVAVVRGAAEAVAAAHGKGVLHRDLKPSNILVDAAQQPRVLDFGLARELGRPAGQTVTVEGGFVGTPAYAPPEQIEGGTRDLDVRADVYGLGAVLYRCVTGRPAFDSGSTLVALIEAVRGGRWAKPSSIQGWIDRELEAIVAMAMSVDREDRYPTAAALAEDLGRWQDGRAVAAHPPGRLYLAWKFYQRHRSAVLAAAAALLLIVAGGAAASVLAFKLSRKDAALELTLSDLERAVEAEKAARARVTASAERAKRQVMQQRAALTVMFDVLADLQRANKAGAAITVNEAIDRRIESLDGGRVRLTPDVRGAIRIAIGVLCLQLERPDVARDQFERVVELLEANPVMSWDLAEAHGQLGSLAMTEGDHDAAVHHFERALERTRADPEQAQDEGPRRLRLAAALLAAGRLDEAEREASGATFVGSFFEEPRRKLLEEIAAKRLEHESAPGTP